MNKLSPRAVLIAWQIESFKVVQVRADSRLIHSHVSPEPPGQHLCDLVSGELGSRD